jgi:hypothetical protein
MPMWMKRLGTNAGASAAFLLACSALAGESAREMLVAISSCHVEATRTLLDSGANPNGADGRGPVLRWLASGRKCTDDDALAVAKLLDAHGARFKLPAEKGPGLLTNLASRHLPRTLAFLAERAAGDPSAALRAIAKGDDVESERVLLEAGADPTEGPALSCALLDATLAGRAGPVAEMLKHVKDPRSPKVVAAAGAARKKGGAVERAFLAAGVQPPATPVPVKRACQPRELTANESRLLARLGRSGEGGCKFLQACGELILIDCNSAADGPAYYIDPKAPKVVATCGGACMGGCSGCPPPDWTCDCR